MWNRNRKPSWWEWNGGIVYVSTVVGMLAFTYVMYAYGLCKGCG